MCELSCICATKECVCVCPKLVWFFVGLSGDPPGPQWDNDKRPCVTLNHWPLEDFHGPEKQL